MITPFSCDRQVANVADAPLRPHTAEDVVADVADGADGGADGGGMALAQRMTIPAGAGTDVAGPLSNPVPSARAGTDDGDEVADNDDDVRQEDVEDGDDDDGTPCCPERVVLPDRRRRRCAPRSVG